SVLIENTLSTCTECTLASWYGFRKAMVVRLENAGKTYGILAVSVPGEVGLEEEERGLLKEVAGDIALALKALELEEEREGAEEAYRTLVQNSLQGLAILPGLSRSGLTIVGGLARRLTPQASARFSFLLSLPAIAGAALVEALGEEGLAAALAGGVPLAGLAAALVAAFLSGLVAMLVLVRVAAGGRLHWFAWYCWLVGAAALIWLWLS
ncbi:MAG: undecaprenyl-diphosphate phosphatase, partial [Firmicutes bacterium]|nr:undecaprenyl-diphosphate phosphatase [Bacillota bacterium]